MKNFFELKGKVIEKIDGLYVDAEEYKFKLRDLGTLTFWHYQECCESVRVQSITGDPALIIDQEIIFAEEDSVRSDTANKTTTTYILRVPSGAELKIVWFGASNGYYSEDVDMRYDP